MNEPRFSELVPLGPGKVVEFVSSSLSSLTLDLNTKQWSEVSELV